MKAPDESAIRAPTQARSRETMDKILAATEALLAEKPFDKITILEIAERSESGVSSIYARFRDKQSLVLGLHARLRERVLEWTEKLSDPQRWRDYTTDEVIARVVPVCVRFYRVHQALIKAALTVDLPEMRERQSSVLRIASMRFAALLAPRYPDQIEIVETTVERAVRLFAWTMYGSLLFRGLEMLRAPMTDRALSEMLTASITAVLNAAVGQERAPKRSARSRPRVAEAG